MTELKDISACFGTKDPSTCKKAKHNGCKLTYECSECYEDTGQVVR